MSANRNMVTNKQHKNEELMKFHYQELYKSITPIAPVINAASVELILK